ncbi:MAG: hypothetical protein ACFCUW_06970 [Kiloniellaceae bacterium]
MLTGSYRRPHDLLARHDLMPAPVRNARLAFKIAVGALLGLLLAVIGSLDPKNQESVDRRALTGAPAEIVAIPRSPWGEAPRGEPQFSH